MFVKALRLAGFKSFAQATVLEFEPGVNVIVGPNGSGKSNIADALSWVLGSQAPSSLRGGSMEDVIFAGSQELPRLGIAEVELTLDNNSGVLPLDLTEVTIYRSTDRTGASEYKINGAPCRLLDVAELLSDTGIGRSIHTVVGQGQLDAVLQARPEDRRSFIEEAAQIGKFRRRKDRALKKIERVDDNLVRLNDVLAELKRAIRPLKRQASAASLYSELMNEHTELRRRLTATEIHRLQTEGARVDPEAEARRAELLSEELATLRARLENAAHRREEAAEAAAAARRTAHRTGRAADKLAALGRLARERAARIGARLAAETEEGYRERIRLLESERDRWAGGLSELQTSAGRARAEAVEAGARAESASRSRAESESRLADSRARETAGAQDLVRAEGREAAARATVGSVEARIHATKERREVCARELAGAAVKLTEAERDVRSLEKDLDTATETAAAAETMLEAARLRADDLRSKLGGTQAGLAGAEARVETLKEVIALFVGRPEVTWRIEPLLVAAEDAARMAVATEQEAARILAEAEERVEDQWREVARHDEELRRLDALVSGAAERVAGRRRERETREIELATLDDELSHAGDALATAEREAAEVRAALPAIRASVEEAARSRVDAEATMTGARAAEAEAAAAAREAELEARTREERALAAQLRVEEATAGIADARAALEGLAGLRATLEAARDRAAKVATISSLAAEHAQRWAVDAEAAAGRAEVEALEIADRVTAMYARERELASGLEEVAKKRNEAEIRRAETRARIDALCERALDEWGMTEAELVALEGFDAETEIEAVERVEKLDRDMRRLGAVNPRAAEEYAELAERETFLTDQIEDLRSSRRDLLKVVHEVDDTIVEAFGRAFTDVAREFEDVFGRLFPGGSGRLRLTDPDSLLTSGIEVEARPPGKNIRKLSLLSGGERSLVALAFLFAIFRARPSPFYLLDEVEAALDDVNLQRFLGLIRELEERAQVLIVTHQKRTMEAADVLYGVSMAKEGVSRVVAKRMEEVTA